MPSRLVLALPLLLALPAPAPAQGLTPEEAVKRMKLPEGFSARCVASEPMIRQPTSISFDNRGRMWVLQYLQYPNYAGLKPVKQDQYLRTIWDKIPEPPPKGPKGLDKITILSDPDEHGVFRKSKDFVTGLNIASGFCIGHGGVYVVQPPYLLFYPDKNEDDVPDGDPEVLLSGFGMDDTHSLANSLQWGPDGWLYGAAGSTSTCKIVNLTHPKDPLVEFQQGIWRFHPKTKKFELFSEGGGNTYGLDFDKNGQVIAGTNYGGVACLHQMQGAYYVKGFSKHGPLHNPHTYGYFEHVPYKGFQGGHVTCGGIVYQADTYPEQYRDQYIAANVLSNTIDWHKLEPVKSSFKASRGGELLGGNDPWFRPIDCLQGPDGCVYVVDFYDRRAAHLDPVDSWDKTNGRVYRIEYKGGPKYPTFDLRKKTTPELVELLKDPNVWYRREARQLLAERQDKAAYPVLAELIAKDHGQLGLEAFWAYFVSGGWTKQVPEWKSTKNEYVRAWWLRCFTDDPAFPAGRLSLIPDVSSDPSEVVLAQAACSAKRLWDASADLLVGRILRNPVTATDPNLRLLVWWATEAELARDGVSGSLFVRNAARWQSPLAPMLAENAARRLMAPDVKHWPAEVYALMNDWKGDPEPLLRGLLKAVTERKIDVARELHWAGVLVELRKVGPNNEILLEILARTNDAGAIATLVQRVADEKSPESARVKTIDVVKQIRPAAAEQVFLTQLGIAKTDALRIALLGGLEAYQDAKIGETVLAAYSGYTPTVKKRVVQLLLTRPAWALELLQRLDKGTFPKADISLDQARTAVKLDNKAVTALVEKHFGKLAPATAGEKQARITWLTVQIPREKNADAARGKVLYTKHCAACHVLHGEGGKVGPDLTTADRKNRGYLVAQIVDPSGYIRPEYVVQTVTTTDERKLSGIAKEVGESVELTNFVDNKPVVAVVAKKDIADIRPSAVSLMPEKILDTLTDTEIADLFAFLQTDKLAPGLPGVPEQKTPGKPGAKLRVALVSGSFEYKSDASLAALKKHLEANYSVECVLISAKSDKDAALAGIEQLEKCDVAVFFTRRLQIEGSALDAVKKYVASKKPIVGIRTASHGFQKWLEMDKDVLGGDYKGHFGAGVADVKVIDKQKDHAILKGVSAFKTNGSLYKNPAVAADVTVLLQGFMGKESEPVAWTREKDGRRVFYTSLGHPDDFKDENFIRLLVNGLAWATKTELKK